MSERAMRTELGLAFADPDANLHDLELTSARKRVILRNRIQGHAGPSAKLPAQYV